MKKLKRVIELTLKIDYTNEEKANSLYEYFRDMLFDFSVKAFLCGIGVGAVIILIIKDFLIQ